VEIDDAALARLEALVGEAKPQSDDVVVTRPQRVAIMGIPRSGSTWLHQTLSHTAGVSSVREPDNTDHFPAALRALRGIGIHPLVASDDECQQLRRCFDAAFGSPVRWSKSRASIGKRLMRPYGGALRRVMVDTAPVKIPLRLRTAALISPPGSSPQQTPTRLVKTVHMALSMEWFIKNYAPTIVVTRRNPLDVLASWISLDINPVGIEWTRLCRPEISEWLDQRGLPQQPNVHRESLTAMAWVIGVLMSGIAEAIVDHPEIVIADHEILCRDPVGEMRHVARQLGLIWTPEAEEFLHSRNRPGAGYDVRRVAAKVPGSWREKLDPDVVATARAMFVQFPWTARYADIVG